MDQTSKDYQVVFKMACFFYFLSTFCYFGTKYIINNCTRLANSDNMSKEPQRGEYMEFQDEPVDLH